MQLETNKHLTRVENSLKDQITEVKREVAAAQEEIDHKIEETVQTARLQTHAILQQSTEPTAPDHQEVAQISREQTGQLNAELAILRDILRELRGRIEVVESMRAEIQQSGETLRKGLEDRFVDLEEKLNSRVEKVMFLVTKIRGDSIIRN